MNKKTIFKFIFFILFLVIAGFLLWNNFSYLFSDVNKIKSFVSQFELLAPLVFILLVVLQVFFAPIPGQLIGIASGYLFGAVFGTVYSMIGLVVGSYLAFLSSRYLGRPFVEKVVEKQTLEKFDSFSKTSGSFVLFLAFLLPFFPDDALCFIGGLSEVKLKKLVLVAFIGRFPGFLVLNLLGAGFFNLKTGIALVATIIVFLIFSYFFREKIKTLYSRFLS